VSLIARLRRADGSSLRAIMMVEEIPWSSKILLTLAHLRHQIIRQKIRDVENAVLSLG
jgi:hypothetical protein